MKISLCALWLWFGVGVAYADELIPPMPNQSLDGTILVAESPQSATMQLEALESRPNVLHGVKGLHQGGRVPLNAVSPNTLKTFVSVVDLIRREYVQEVNDEQLFEGAMRGMLTNLDHNAEFLDKTAFANLQSFTQGTMATVGLQAEWHSKLGHWVVVSVADNSPAQKAGIDNGDYLHQIGDIKLTHTHHANDVMQLLNGIAGTQVDIVFSKAGRFKHTASLQRTQLVRSTIETIVYDGVAVIKLPVFQNTTREQILNSLANSQTPIQGVILDVRNNPGGVLEAAAQVASLFIKGQVVAKVANKNGIERVLMTEGASLLGQLPVMVLQNRYSASAAEVLASSLQVKKHALVVGETSYGKGTVQSVIPIGDNQAVKLTTAYYLTADGEKIDGVGVVPDVSFADDDDMQDQNNPQQDISESADEFIKDDWLSRALSLMNRAKLETGIVFDPVGGF